jgi:putative hydrolase of the HAD superfamily
MDIQQRMNKLTYPALIIFDLDDTLINFSGSSGECWRNAYEEYSSEIPDISCAQFQQTVKDYADWYWSDPVRHRTGRMQLIKARCEIVCESLRRLGTNNDSLGYKMGEYYSLQRDKFHALFPETLEVLDYLLQQSVRLALITNGMSDMQWPKIDRFNLRPYFKTILVEGDFGCGKPDERVYRHVLNETSVECKDAWMIGDNLEWDVFAPKRLGITGIWYNRKERKLPANSDMQPDRIIRTLRDLV